ncbi:hypothetical protein ZHAS_00015413 [Anopheles sinensis]|uniref:Uncharacterized protein n=1 Tax=Anopheles sinensis TaxID=74873 RepID=A0A084WB70_ANOSI|nr:hypothetical protein ZHAS_00015413 [Anopheles sinensis]
MVEMGTAHGHTEELGAAWAKASRTGSSTGRASKNRTFAHNFRSPVPKNITTNLFHMRNNRQEATILCKEIEVIVCLCLGTAKAKTGAIASRSNSCAPRATGSLVLAYSHGDGPQTTITAIAQQQQQNSRGRRCASSTTV